MATILVVPLKDDRAQRAHPRARQNSQVHWEMAVPNLNTG